MSEWNICIENCTIISIYLNILLVFTVFTLWHTYERMSKYILTNKFGTNECPNVIICDQYIQIFQNACIQDVCICIYDPGSGCVCINLSTNKQTSRSLIHVFGECMMHTSRILLQKNVFLSSFHLRDCFPIRLNHFSPVFCGWFR